MRTIAVKDLEVNQVVCATYESPNYPSGIAYATGRVHAPVNERRHSLGHKGPVFTLTDYWVDLSHGEEKLQIEEVSRAHVRHDAPGLTIFLLGKWNPETGQVVTA